MNLVIFTEEPSMKTFLDVCLLKIRNDFTSTKIIVHNGISDLKKSLPNKLRGWRAPNSFFLILVDQDSADCKDRKNEFVSICMREKDANQFAVCIVCRELEAWFLGSPDAIMTSELPNCNRISSHRNKTICLNPDQVKKPSERLDALLDGYQKNIGAMQIAQNFEPDKNSSASFNHFRSKILAIGG